MGFIDKIKSAITEPDAPVEQVKQTPPTKKITVVGAYGENTSLLPVPSLDMPVVAQANPDIVETLNKAVGNAKNQTFVQFSKVVGTMQALPQAQRYPMAFNVLAATNGITPNDVLYSLDESLKILEEQEAQFNQYIVDFTTNELDTRVKTTSDINKLIETKLQEIDKLKEQRSVVMTETNDVMLKINNDKAAFEASFNVVKAGLDTERNIITQIIPAK